MSIQCLQCEKYQKELEEREKQLAILKENILETKQNIIESSNLIIAYVEIKSENELLKKENEDFRLSKETKLDQYKLDIFKKQMINLNQKNVELKLAYDQTTSLLAQYQASKDTNNLKENKLLHELSEKDRYINNQNLIINRLKNEKKTNMVDERNEELILEKQQISSNTNIIQLNQLVDENECLERNYKKYQNKYYKYKYKLQEFKECTMMFLERKYEDYDGGHDIMLNMLKRKRNNNGDDIENYRNQNNKRNNHLHNNRTSFDFENCKIEDIFEGMNDIVEEENIIDNYNENNVEALTKNQSQKVTKIKKTEELKIQRKSKKLNKKIRKLSKDKRNENDDKSTDDNLDIKEDDNQINTNKQKKQKTKQDKVKIVKANQTYIKTKTKKINEKEPNQKTREAQILKEQQLNPKIEKQSESQIKLPISHKISKKELKFYQPISHINPIKKSKQNYHIEQFKDKNFSSSLILFINENKQLSKEDFLLLLDLYPTISEKVTSVLEVILQNITLLNISSTLQIIDLFISSFDSNIVIANFFEFINTHLNSLSQDKNFIYIKNSTTSHRFSDELLSSNHTSTSFISYLMEIFFSYHNYPEVTQFFFNLLDTNNIKISIRFQIIDFFNTLHKENANHVNDQSPIKYINPNDFESYKNSNKHSIYFFSNYKSRLISNDVFNYILFISDGNQSQDLIDLHIISSIKSKLTSINDFLFSFEGQHYELNIENDLCYLEIYQMIYIAFGIRDIDWIYDRIFTSLLWEEFSVSKDKSFKRAMIIFYSSVIYYIGLNKDNSEMKDKTLKIFGWLYAIYSKQFEPDKISIYDQICALSWVVDSPLITLYENPTNNMKEIIGQLLKIYSIDFLPQDFVAILKKNKFIQ